jgi:hypothetical protein
MSEIAFVQLTRVCPGAIIDIHGVSVVVTLTQISSETWDDFVSRCEDIANYAVSKSPQARTNIIDASDTTKYKQVAPNSYEIITPGYEPPET